MKKIIYAILFLLLIYDTKAQNISFSSNGHINNFTKIDTLFFTAYAGRKPSTKSAFIDTAFSQSLLQFDSSFGFITKTLSEAQNAESKLSRFNKLFATPFYAYTDGALEAPTSVLFFKPKSDSAVLQAFSPFGRVVKHSILHGYYYLYTKTNVYNNGDKIFALCDSLNRAGLTRIVEPVFLRQLKLNADPLLPNEWNVSNTGQYAGTPGADMKVSNVWNMGYTGSGVRVAVIDLGVDLTHPDLQANLLTGFDATGNNSAGAPIYDQYNTHGTECAGIIGEIANSVGGVGVAYNAHIIPIRFGTVAPPNVNPNGYITTSDTWESNCFNYAVNNGADIISNSWGTPGGSSSAQLDAAIANAVSNGRAGKGSIVLFAAGNENSSIDYPALNTNVIAVGASCECDTRKRSSNNPAVLNPGVSADPLGVSCDGEFWWGSNFGSGLDLMAPGVNITTTSFTANADGTHTDTYVANFNGTSAATPNTAAVLALILSANPNLTGQQARNILESSTDKVGGYTYQPNILGQPNGSWSSDAGYGRVNACAAVSQVLPSVLNISGDQSFCTTSNPYSIPNLPIGATVQWQATPDIVTINSPNATQTTLTKTANGIVTLTASVTTACGNFSINRTITVGTPAPTFINGFGWNGTHFGANEIYEFSVDPVAGVTNFQWGVSGHLNTIISGQGTNTIDLQTQNVNSPDSGSLYLTVKWENACGWSDNLVREGIIYSSGGAEIITIAPNPAQNILNISTSSLYITNDAKTLKSAHANNNSNNSSVKSVLIYNINGVLVKQQAFGTGTLNAQVNISDLTRGNYFVKTILYNGDSETQQVNFN